MLKYIDECIEKFIIKEGIVEWSRFWAITIKEAKEELNLFAEYMYFDGEVLTF